MSQSKALAECVVETIKLLKESQRDLTLLADKVGGLEEILQKENPKAYESYVARKEAHRKGSAPFDADFATRRVDELIRRAEELLSAAD